VRRAVAVALLAVCCAGCKRDPAEGQAAGSAADKSYRVTVEPPAAGRVGEALVATIRLEPRGIYKVNLEYPTKLTVSGPAAATPRRLELRAKDAAKLDKGVGVFKPAVKLAEGGKHPFTATFKFSVCTEELCELKTEKLTWTASAQ
jgi:hypothetical protein